MFPPLFLSSPSLPSSLHNNQALGKKYSERLSSTRLRDSLSRFAKQKFASEQARETDPIKDPEAGAERPVGGGEVGEEERKGGEEEGKSEGKEGMRQEERVVNGRKEGWRGGKRLVDLRRKGREREEGTAKRRIENCG